MTTKARKPRLKLYEFSAMVSVHIVVAAESEEAARAEIEPLEETGWIENGDLLGLSDVELTSVRKLSSIDPADDAHLIATPSPERPTHDDAR